MLESLTNVPVAIIFFNRPDTLAEVFKAVKQARPSKLFLIQDGARENNEADVKNIQLCRDAVSDIDWECDVHKIYSDKNLGCGKRVFTGLTEAFEYVDKLIILEDDIVPSPDFFTFCDQMLQKYKEDDRILSIAGMNHCGIYDKCPHSYFYSDFFSCWGWATWKRAWNKMEYDCAFVDDTYFWDLFKKSKCRTRAMMSEIVEECQNKRRIIQKGEKMSSWARQFYMTGIMNSMLTIIPKYNLISNIGLTANSEHASDSIKKIPKGLRSVFFAKHYNMEYPLSHPEYMMPDKEYVKIINKILGTGFFAKRCRKVEGILRRLIFSDAKSNKKMLKKIIKI